MLVIARKPHEALTIDGNIRVEVLRLTGGVARLRFVAPRQVAITRGIAKPGDPAAVEAVNGGIDASGMGIVDLTLANHQIITLSSDIHLGLVDVDATRALLFVDVPTGLSVKAETAAKSRLRAAGSEGGDEVVQAFLPFTTPPDPLPNGPSARAPREDPAEAPPEDPMLRTIPFPGTRGVEDRDP